jgi:F5/8 type C domain
MKLYAISDSTFIDMGYFFLAMFAGTNVAFRKPANQSSSMRGGPAANANDGDTEVIHDGKRCTETSREPSPWWRVDLLREYPIRAVRLTSRGCCGQYKYLITLNFSYMQIAF